MSEANTGSNVAAGDDGLTSEERTELERLRAEVSDLQSRPAVDPGRRWRPGWRAPLATVLVALGCLLAPISVIAVWTANQVSDTSRYVANVEPLIHQPAVQNALTDKVSNEITSRLNVAGLTNQAATALTDKGLPRVGTLLKGFSGPLASAVDGYIHGQVHRIVTSPRFAQTWVQVNTVAHGQIVSALSGRGDSVKVSNGQVTISLAPFINIVKQDLSGRGLTIVNQLPQINPTLTLFSAKYLVKAQTGYRLLNDLKIVLPILALLLIGLGIYVARSHRRAVIGAGLGLAASMLVLAAGLLIFRGIYLNSVPNSKLPSDAAAALFDTFVRFIKQGLRVLLVVGLVAAAAAFMTGPSVTAVRSRRAFSSGLRWLRERGELIGLRTGPVGRWTYAHRTGLRIGATALAALIFVFWGRPTALVVILIAVLLLAVLGLIELIGRPPARPEMTAHP